MSNRRILITGATGFTGKYVLPALKKEGFEPCALRANLCDEKAVTAEVVGLQPCAALHLAGIAYVGHGNPADFYRVNLIGTFGLLQALERAGSVTGPVVLASSANIYGNSYQNEHIKEYFLPNPLNDYAISKHAMEEMGLLRKWRLPITIVRPFNYTGVGQSTTFIVPKIVSAFRNRSSLLNLGNIDVWRDFTDVRDVARWYVELIKRNINGEIINFCSGHLSSLRDVVMICEEISNHKLDVVSSTEFKRSNDLIRLCGDNSHLKELIGKDGNTQFDIRETIHWMMMKTEV